MNKGNRFSVQALFFVAACMLEGYFLLEYRSVPLLVAVGAILVLAASYVFMNALWIEYENQKEEKRQEQRIFMEERLEEKWKEVEKVQKAMYVVTKRYAENVQEGMEQIKAELELERKLSEAHMEEIVKYGERAVKIMIKYNRMDAKKIAAFHKKENEKIVETIQTVTEILKQGLEENATVMKQTQVAATMGKEILSAENSLPIEEPSMEPIEEIATAEEIMPEEPVIEEVIEEEPVMEESVLQEVEEEPVEETKAEEIKMDDPNKIMSPDDIAALLASVNEVSEEAEKKEELQSEEPVMEESVLQEVEEEPAEEIKAEEIKMDDPNKVMSPDDIAALLASMNN